MPPSPADAVRHHRRAVAQALLVTFLWATSWVLIKLALPGIPALTFAGLRYTAAWLCLLPFACAPRPRAELRRLTRGDWLGLGALGLLFYAVTQGAQFLGLALLPAVTVSLLLNCTTIVVAGLGGLFLRERPGRRQWIGVGIYAAGAAVYFGPGAVPGGEPAGYAVMAVGVLANAGSALLGRAVNRRAHLPPLLVTVVSLGVGAAALLVAGIATQGLPALGPAEWAVVAWLAVVNTAFAFTLWNRVQRTLTATESTVINGTMLGQIAFLAWLCLGEPITPAGLTGIALAGAGAMVVQLRPRGKAT